MVMVTVAKKMTVMIDRDRHSFGEPPFEMEYSRAVGLVECGLLAFSDTPIAAVTVDHDRPLLVIPSADDMIREIEDDGISIEHFSGITDKILNSLRGAGIETMQDLTVWSADDLSSLKGISKAKAEVLLVQARRFVGGEE
jgi:hypothetical protein